MMLMIAKMRMKLIMIFPIFLIIFCHLPSNIQHPTFIVYRLLVYPRLISDSDSPSLILVHIVMTCVSVSHVRCLLYSVHMKNMVLCVYTLEIGTDAQISSCRHGDDDDVGDGNASAQFVV